MRLSAHVSAFGHPVIGEFLPRNWRVLRVRLRSVSIDHSEVTFSPLPTARSSALDSVAAWTGTVLRLRTLSSEQFEYAVFRLLAKQIDSAKRAGAGPSTPFCLDEMSKAESNPWPRIVGFCAAPLAQELRNGLRRCNRSGRCERNAARISMTQRIFALADERRRNRRDGRWIRCYIGTSRDAKPRTPLKSVCAINELFQQLENPSAY